MRIDRHQPEGPFLLPTPADLRAEAPATPAIAADVAATRDRIRRLIHGDDTAMLVIVGPCSIHDHRAAIEYAHWLAGRRRRFAGVLEIVMRVYLQKPRTRGGWPGLVHDPGIDGSCRVGDGLRLGRRVLADVNAIGVPAATEFVDPWSVPYLADLVSWSSIGARTVEGPIHRQMAAGLDCPVGFKNSTAGSIDVALDGMAVARTPQPFISLTDDGRAGVAGGAGNADVHLVLRGGPLPNCDAASVAAAAARLRADGLPSRVLVDCSHGNARGHAGGQAGVAAGVAALAADGSRSVLGVMIESHLVAGRQTPPAGQPGVFGQSITDSCIGLDATDRALEALAAAVSREALTSR